MHLADAGDCQSVLRMPGTVVESEFHRCKHHNLPFYVDTVTVTPGNAGVIQIAVCAKKVDPCRPTGTSTISIVQQPQLIIPTHPRGGGRRWPLQLQVLPLCFSQGNP